ncbi:MAG: periplasmic heavy metal sensor [Pseudolabrys sp.]
MIIVTQPIYRWLTLTSLGLNLLFAGIAIAIVIRIPTTPADYDVFVHFERLSNTLPPADARLLRGQINASREAIKTAQMQYHAMQDQIRKTLRRDPFDLAAARAGMANIRVARENFDQVIQNAVAITAPQMSPAGRRALADWPPVR